MGNVTIHSDTRITSSADKPLVVAGLYFSYPNLHLFENFSLESGSRRIVLKGSSGCGKTTLLKLIFGSIRPQSASTLPKPEGATLLLQEDALFPWHTGRKNVEMMVRHTDRIEAHPLFEVISSFVDRRVCEMSFGQRRSVELFRAILFRPKALYMDEPFNYLDDQKAEAFIRYLTSHEVSDLLVITTHRTDPTLDSSADALYFAGSPPYHGLLRITQ